MQRNWGKLNIKDAVSENKNYSSTLRWLDIDANSGNIKLLKSWIAKLGIDTSHFSPFGHGNGGNCSTKKKELSDIMTKDSYYLPSRLKKRLVKAGIFDYKCSECGLNEWRGKYISLQLDHINGDRSDNRIDNVRILCPNCHSQTETFCVKNRKDKRKEWVCSFCGGKTSQGKNRCWGCWVKQCK